MLFSCHFYFHVHLIILSSSSWEIMFQCCQKTILSATFWRYFLVWTFHPWLVKRPLIDVHYALFVLWLYLWWYFDQTTLNVQSPWSKSWPTKLQSKLWTGHQHRSAHTQTSYHNYPTSKVNLNISEVLPFWGVFPWEKRQIVFFSFPLQSSVHQIS